MSNQPMTNKTVLSSIWYLFILGDAVTHHRHEGIVSVSLIVAGLKMNVLDLHYIISSEFF